MAPLTTPPAESPGASAPRVVTREKLFLEGKGFNLPNGIEPYIKTKDGTIYTASVVTSGDGQENREVEFVKTTEGNSKSTPEKAYAITEKNKWVIRIKNNIDGRIVWSDPNQKDDKGKSAGFHMTRLTKRVEVGGAVSFYFDRGSATLSNESTGRSFDKGDNLVGGQSTYTGAGGQIGGKAKLILYKSRQGGAEVAYHGRFFAQVGHLSWNGGSNDVSGQLEGLNYGLGVEVDAIVPTVSFGSDTIKFDLSLARLQAIGAYATLNRAPVAGLVLQEDSYYQPSDVKYRALVWKPLAASLHFTPGRAFVDVTAGARVGLHQLLIGDLGPKPSDGTTLPAVPAQMNAISGGIDLTVVVGKEKSAPTITPSTTALPTQCTPDKESVRQSIIQLFETRQRLIDAAHAAIDSGKTVGEVKAFLTKETEAARNRYIKDRLSTRDAVKRFRDTLIGNALLAQKVKPGEEKEENIPQEKRLEIDRRVKQYIGNIAITEKDINEAKEALPDIVLNEESINSLGSGPYKVTLIKDASGKVVDINLPDSKDCNDIAVRYQSTATAATPMKNPPVKPTVSQEAVGDFQAALATNKGLVLNFRDAEPGLSHKKASGAYGRNHLALENAIAETKVKDFKASKAPQQAAELLRPFMDGNNTKSLATLIESLQLNKKPSFLTDEQWENLKILAPYITLHVVGKADGRGSRNPYDPSPKNVKLSGDRATAVTTAILQAGTPFNVVAEDLEQAKKIIIGSGTLLDLIIASETGGSTKGQQLQNRSVYIYAQLDQESYLAAEKAGKAAKLKTVSVTTAAQTPEKAAAAQTPEKAAAAQTPEKAAAAQTPEKAAAAPAPEKAAAAPAKAAKAKSKGEKLNKAKDVNPPAQKPVNNEDNQSKLPTAGPAAD